jgi:AraC-like DNA-binding protein
VLINNIQPSPPLREFVRLYRIIDFHFPDIHQIPFKAYPPRPEHCLQFMPHDCETVRYPVSGKVLGPQGVILMGPHESVIHRYPGKDTLGLQVIFQPGAIYQLTRFRSAEFTGQYLDARLVFGNIVELINEKLFHAKDYKEMIFIAESFVADLAKGARFKKHAVDEAAKMMNKEDEDFFLNKFIRSACLSPRQLDRIFLERIGLSPKQFLQMSRFDKVFRMKNRFPEKDWLTIALHCGYHDYQHMSKDYKQFTGYTPVQFFAIDNAAPERIFGDVED